MGHCQRVTDQMWGVPSPYGRYLTPRRDRILQMLTAPIVLIPPLISMTSGPASSRTPNGFVGVFVVLFLFYIGVVALAWFVPRTIIDAQGIERRWLVRPKKVAWSEVFDARPYSRFGTKYVLLLLWDNRQVPLYAVPETAIDGIRALAASNPAHPAHRPDPVNQHDD